ncbi:MAG TPA: hypothetical protein VM935_05250, partial [Chitinophagaceae bacterium]|nr:hypothetical protein [Chitinophagaceae bacterium]
KTKIISKLPSINNNELITNRLYLQLVSKKFLGKEIIYLLNLYIVPKYGQALQKGNFLLRGAEKGPC